MEVRLTNRAYIFLNTLSKLPLTFWGKVGAVLVLIFSLSFFVSSLVYAVEDGCWNKDKWGENRQSKFFTKDEIIPNRWPDYAFDLKESMDTFYPDGYTARNTEVGPCAGYFCQRASDKVGYFTVADKANPKVCQCTVNIANLCNDMEVYVVSDPDKRSGPSGNRMPDFPDPQYPNEWDQKFYYKGKYEGDLVDIKSYLLGRVPEVYKDSTTSVTACSGIDIVGSGDKIGNIRKYVINNIKTVKQSFSQWYSAWGWTQDFGVCGNKVWSWREGRHLDAERASISHDIPVEVLFPKWVEKVTDAIEGCPKGTEDSNNPGTCKHSIANTNADSCPVGYTFKYGPFGTSTCTKSNISMASHCTSGVLLEDTSTTPYTYTCLDGSFSKPETQEVNICGAKGQVAISEEGEYDGSFTLEKNLDRTEEVEGEEKSESNKVLPGIDPPKEREYELPDLPTEKTLSEGVRHIEGIHYGKGFEGSCIDTHSDVEYLRTSYEGNYPRGWLGNDCVTGACLLKITMCEFERTKFGTFIDGFNSISGHRRLPAFDINLGSWGVAVLDFNTPVYVTVFDFLRKVLILVCFLAGLRILAS